ncbi:TPA: hypothetical protein ACH3X2_14289 [Trebouxia sp. C0005]
MCSDADKARRDEQFEIGEFVLLSSKFLRVHVGRKKLLSKYLGPFEIVAKRGAVAYELRLPVSLGKMHDVFHVSLLKRYKDGCRGSAPPPAVLPDGEVECEIEKVLAHHDSKTGRRSYLVQWRGLPSIENQWLTASRLKNATDVVQAYLNGLSDKGRAAARVGRPDGAAAQNSSQNANAVSDSENTDMAAAATQQPRRRGGRPRKADKQTGNQAGRASKKRGRGRPRKQS